MTNNEAKEGAGMDQRTANVDTQPFECVPHWLLMDPELTANSLRVWLVLRKHRNYETGECWPGRRRIATLCGLSLKTVDRSLVNLEQVGAVTVERRLKADGSHNSNHYQVHWDRWGKNDATLASETPQGVGTKTTLELIPISNQDQRNESGDPEHVALCELLADRIEQNGSKRPTVTKRWTDAARLMIDRDNRPVEEIRACIEWSQQHEFWRGVILSMPKVREKFDQMRLQAERGRKPSKMQAHLALVERLRDNEADGIGGINR